MRRAGIDIGGTFTDLVFWDDEAGEVFVHKLPSTPDDPASAGIQGLKELLSKAGRKPQDLDFLVHGTTVATNILLEKDGATVGMITTRGFRDILHIGRKDRPFNFSHVQDVPRQNSPLIKRRHRLTVTERISAPNGDVTTPLNEDEVRTAVKQLRDNGIESIAICCLMSFLNPQHEQRIRDIVEQEFPEVYLSTSHGVAPLYREYERFSTTALNAYVGPKTAHYLDNFSIALKASNIKSELNLMTSAGGVVPSGEAANRPVSLLLSGPVGALIAGIEIGKQINHTSVITLDVGGTSTDIGVAANGVLRMKHLLDTKIGDYDAMMPMVDIDTIGAGGGSVAYQDEGNMFRVGPQSAGAKPGPACYAKGGTEPTVTDACAVLGWFREEAKPDSGLTVNTTLARDAIRSRIAEPLDLDVMSSAAGIYRIAVNNMVESVRLNSISKGYDPRDFALVAFGGAGAAFAVEAASLLAIPKVVIPMRPGVGAAAGLLATDTKYEHRATVWEKLDQPNHQRIDKALASLEKKARKQLVASGFSSEQTQITYLAECRYLGQGYELTVETPPLPVDDDWIKAVSNRFHAAHEQSYLRRFEENTVVIINVGLAGSGKIKPLTNPLLETGQENYSDSAVLDTRTTYFVEKNHAVPYETVFLSRDGLKAGNQIAGPAIIEQTDTTTVLPSGTRAVVDAFGNLVVSFTGDTNG